MNKEEIKKLIDKEINKNESKLTFYNLFFLAIAIFFGSLIQILIYYFTYSKYLIPIYFKILIATSIAIIMFILYWVLAEIIDKINIKRGKFLHYVLIPSALVISIILIYFFILFQGPKAILSYKISCPRYLDIGANISLYVENRGDTIPSIQFFSNSNADIIFVDLYEDKISSSSPSTRIVFPEEKYTSLYPLYIKDDHNFTNIVIYNFFECDASISKDCILVPIVGNEQKCSYKKKNNKFEKGERVIIVNLTKNVG